MEDADLPRLAPAEKFRFGCGPGQPCFNRCCAQLSLPLTPYDALRMSRNLGMANADFLRTFTGRRKEPQTGFQMFSLRMIDSPDAPCPFVTPAGCSVYDDRPGACRAYPLGRGTRLSARGISERYFMIREEHCCGHASGPAQSAAEWFASQGLERYNYFNDRLMRLMSMVAATGEPLNERLSSMASLSLWEIDRFRQFLRKLQVFRQLELPPENQARILEESAAGDDGCLDFGMSWLELVIFGTAPDLTPRSATR